MKRKLVSWLAMLSLSAACGPAAPAPPATLNLTEIYNLVAGTLQVEAAMTEAARPPERPTRTSAPLTATRAPSATPKPTLAPTNTVKPSATLLPSATFTPQSPLQSSNCHPSYPDVCIQIGSADYDCAGGSGNGPNYIKGPFRVLHNVPDPDPYDLDRDGDGIGCE